MHSANIVAEFDPPYLQKFVPRFWGKVRVRSDFSRCWEWAASLGNSGGYGQISVNRGSLSVLRTHCVSYVLAYGRIPDGLWVLHKCNNRLCVNPKHLYAGTPAQNTADAIRAGHNKPMLTDEQVRRVAFLVESGQQSFSEIASEYGCHPSTVSESLQRFYDSQPVQVINRRSRISKEAWQVSCVHQYNASSSCLHPLVGMALAWSLLPTISKQVIERRYGLHSSPKTLREIGDELGVTYQYVDQLHNRALASLRECPDMQSVYEDYLHRRQQSLSSFSQPSGTVTTGKTPKTPTCYHSRQRSSTSLTSGSRRLTRPPGLMVGQPTA